MARWLRRIWPNWPRRISDKGKNFTIISALVGVAAALLLLWRLDVALQPALASLAAAQVERAVRVEVEEAFGQLLEEQPQICQGLYTVETGPDGAVATLEADSARLSALRTQLLAKMIRQVEALDSKELSVPLGSLTGWSLLSNRGPSIGVEVLAVSTPTAQFTSAFEAAGVNQTLHQVTLDLTVEVTLFMAGSTTVETVSVSLPVSEIVVVGQVPETYLNWNP